MSLLSHIAWMIADRVRKPLLLVAAVVVLAVAGVAPEAQEQGNTYTRTDFEHPAYSENGVLFDAVVDAIGRSFWDKDRLAEIKWIERAAQVRQSIVDAQGREEVARRINAYLDELKTSHTIFLTPDDADYYVLKDVFGQGRPLAGIGLYTARVDGRHFADLVLEGYPAERADIKVGDEIVTVDGEPYHPVRSFRGKVGTDVAVGIRRVDGGPIVTVEVDVVSFRPVKAFSEATVASAKVIEHEGRRIGYVHVWASIGDADKALAEALDRIGVNTRPERTGVRISRVDALIIDMRGKIGGFVGMATRYLEFIDPRGPLITQRGMSQSGRTSLRGRTALLIDHHTRSTAEVFVHSYKRERQGPLIGTTTAGAVSGGKAIPMPGDNLLHVAVSGLVIDGDVVEGVGVAPDVKVGRPLPYANGADPVLDAAVELLARGLPARTPVQQDLKGNSQ